MEEKQRGKYIGISDRDSIPTNTGKMTADGRTPATSQYTLISREDTDTLPSKIISKSLSASECSEKEAGVRIRGDQTADNMMALACINQLLSWYAGAALAAFGVLMVYLEGGGGGEALPGAVREEWYVPAAAGSSGLALLLLSLLAAAGSTARRSISRVLLNMYGALCILWSCVALSAAAWAGVALAEWLRGEDASRALGRDAALRVWLRPLLPLLAPEHINTMFSEAEVRADVVGVSCACAALPLLLLAAGVAALCARPASQRTEPTYGSSRSNSLHYESTSLYKIPLNNSAVWQ